jgi:hypothetical protein
MALAIEIGVAWFALSIPVGILVGKAIKRGNPCPDEVWLVLRRGAVR